MRRRVRTGQLIIAEVTGVVVIVSAFAPRWVLLGVASLAAAVLLATFGRAGGRWWYEAVALTRRFRRRRVMAAVQVLAAAVDGGSVPAPVAWLRTLAPTLAMRPVTMGTTTLAVGSDGDGWFSVVEVSWAGGVGAGHSALWDDDPFAPARADLMGSGADVSPWAPGAATVRLRPTDAAALPYREIIALLDQVSAVALVLTAGPVPRVPRLAWVAVRVSPGDALATERTGGVSAVERTVAAAALKAVRTLEAAGWAARAVAPDELVPVLIDATGLDGPPQEHWTYWRGGRAVRTHYTVAGWTPGHGTLAPGISQLAVRFSRRPDDTDPLERAAVVAVVSAPPAALRRTCHEVVTAASGQAVRLVRLDGEQALAAYAAAPAAAPMAVAV